MIVAPKKDPSCVANFMPQLTPPLFRVGERWSWIVRDAEFLFHRGKILRLDWGRVDTNKTD